MIKTILVPICHKEDINQNLDFAVQLANKFDAHIKVLHVIAPIELVVGTVPMELGWVPMESGYSLEAYKQFQKSAEEQAEKYRKICEKKLSNKSVRFDWCLEKGDLLKYLYTYSRTSDVSVISQKGNEFTEVFDVMNDFIIGSGLPVIVVPKTEAGNFRLNNILVAWDGSRECANATRDALPFLKIADKVVVATITEEYKTHLPEADICVHLSRHDVNVEALTLSDSTPPERRIIDTAESIDADMIVAGAWGHRRLTEFVFGGVTSELLNNQRWPIFLAH